MRVSSASFLADGAGGVARAHPAAGRFRRRLAVALYRRPAAAAAESRDRPGPGPRRRRGASRAPHAARHARRSGGDGGVPAGARDAGAVRRARAGIDLGLEALAVLRSEEHTSELQSRSDLVCRLLLEKKKKNHKSM